MYKSTGLGALVCAALTVTACTETEASPAEAPVEASADAVRGAFATVFTLDNKTDKNSVIALRSRFNGSLEVVDTYPTGGLDSGGGLGSQGAVIISDNGRYLFAVNAGSDEISSFEFVGSELVLRDIVSSGGVRPISLTQRHDLLYVVNAGSADAAAGISGFTVDRGRLAAIPGSARALSTSNPAPAQISFSPHGDFLLVTEKATNNLVSYVLAADGTPGTAIVTPSSGRTPFGFAFRDDGSVYVSEAFGGDAGASAVSSYRLRSGGVVELISGSVPTHQTAACWVAISPNGRFVYTTNAGSDTVSGFQAQRSGQVQAFADGGATAAVGDAPIDATFGGSGDVLYVLNGGDDSISTLAVRGNGTLRTVSTLAGLPASTVGIAAR